MFCVVTPILSLVIIVNTGNNTEMHTHRVVHTQPSIRVIISAVLALSLSLSLNWWACEMYKKVIISKAACTLAELFTFGVRNSEFTEQITKVWSKFTSVKHKITKITRFTGQFGVKLFHKHWWIGEHACTHVLIHSHMGGAPSSVLIYGKVTFLAQTN